MVERMKELEQLAAFVAETSYADIPTEVVQRAVWVLRDTVGVIIAGMAEPEVRALAETNLADHILPYDGPIQFDDTGETIVAKPVVMQVQDGAVVQCSAYG